MGRQWLWLVLIPFLFYNLTLCVDRVNWQPPTHSLPAARRGPQFINWIFKADPTEELKTRLDKLFSFVENAFCYEHKAEWLAWTYTFFTAFNWKAGEIPLVCCFFERRLRRLTISKFHKSPMAPLVWPRLKKMVSLIWTHAFARRPPPFYISKVLYETDLVAGPRPECGFDSTDLTEETQWTLRYLCNAGQGCGDLQLSGAVFGLLVESKQPSYGSPLLDSPIGINPLAFSGLFVPLSALSFDKQWMPHTDFPTQSSVLLLRWMKAVFPHAPVSTDSEAIPKRKENRGPGGSKKYNVSPTATERAPVRAAVPKRARRPTLPLEEPEGHREVQRELIKFLSLASDGSNDMELRILRRTRFKVPHSWLENGIEEALVKGSVFKSSGHNVGHGR